MLENAGGRSKGTLSQVAPQILHERRCRHGGSLSAKNAAAQSDRFESVPLRQTCFLIAETAFGTDYEKNRAGIRVCRVYLL
jgi:hypothetical protein